MHTLCRINDPLCTLEVLVPCSGTARTHRSVSWIHFLIFAVWTFGHKKVDLHKEKPITYFLSSIIQLLILRIAKDRGSSVVFAVFCHERSGYQTGDKNSLSLEVIFSFLVLNQRTLSACSRDPVLSPIYYHITLALEGPISAATLHRIVSPSSCPRTLASYTIANSS